MSKRQTASELRAALGTASSAVSTPAGAASTVALLASGNLLGIALTVGVPVLLKALSTFGDADAPTEAEVEERAKAMIDVTAFDRYAFFDRKPPDAS